MVAVIKPILFAFLQSDSVKKLVVDLLSAYAKTTDNTIDDAAVELVRKNLLTAEWVCLITNESDEVASSAAQDTGSSPVISIHGGAKVSTGF